MSKLWENIWTNEKLIYHSIHGAWKTALYKNFKIQQFSFLNSYIEVWATVFIRHAQYHNKNKITKLTKKDITLMNTKMCSGNLETKCAFDLVECICEEFLYIYLYSLFFILVCMVLWYRQHYMQYTVLSICVKTFIDYQWRIDIQGVSI